MSAPVNPTDLGSLASSGSLSAVMAATSPGVATSTTSMSTIVPTNMAGLATQAPEVLKAMEQSIIQKIMGDAQRHNRRIKEINAEARRDAGEG